MHRHYLEDWLENRLEDWLDDRHAASNSARRG